MQNGLEESINADVGVPLNEVSSKQENPQEDATNPIPTMNKTGTSKLAGKAVHRTNEHKTPKGDIDNQEKVFKKPDKVLPCPRCNSSETKFCYFNNYNVNQPRHFCKNCQRYWTAGGTIRNVPVGAGKRRGKHSPLQHCQVSVTPDAVPVVIHTDLNPATDKHISSSIVPSVNIPSLGEEVPLCESLETVLNLKSHRKIEMDSSTVKEDIDEDPSVIAAEFGEKEYSENGIEHVGLIQQCNGLLPLHSLHYYTAPSWTCQWNPCWNAMSTSSYWGCMPNWAGRQIEEYSFNGIPSPSSSASSGTFSGNRSPTLGKHCRDGSTLTEDDTMKKNIWVPKTIRINDPEEAAKSSIWSTLTTKSQQNKPVMKGSVFKSFEPKSNAKSRNLDDNQILRANPAAFCRSGSFQESM